MKNNLLKRIFFAAALFCASGLFYAQITIDPNLDFYESARVWQVKGYVDHLPQISPYPAAVVRDILDAVIENGSEADAETAEYYYEKYFNKKWHVSLEAGARVKLSDTDNDKFIFAEPTIAGDVMFKDWLTLGYKMGLLIHDSGSESYGLLSAYENSLYDTWGDPASIGPFEGNWDMAAGLNMGVDKISGIVAASRLGYNSIFGHDNIILNSTAPHMNNFVFNVAGQKVQYSQVLSELAASQNNGLSPVTGNLKPDKFLAFHSIRWTPIRQLSVSYFEAAAFGPRFDPGYIIPAPFILLQGIFGNGDNDIYGLNIQYRPVDRVECALSFAVDDISIDGIFSGDFNSKLKMSLQTGVVYTPAVDFCKKLSLDYTMVLPYMYTHGPESPGELQGKSDTNGNWLGATADTYNYQNYVHNDICIGSSLAPNSDRVHFEIAFEPVKRLKLNVASSFMRHANVTESYDDKAVIQLATNSQENGVDNSGDVHTNPTSGDNWSTQDKNLFMDQDNVMMVFQFGINASWEAFRKKYGTLTLNFGYTFEFIHNKGVDSAIYTSSAVSAINAASDGEKAAAIQAAKDTWLGNLHNEINNYFMLSVKYTY